MIKTVIASTLFAATLAADTQTLMAAKGAKIAHLLCDQKQLERLEVKSPREAKAKIAAQNLCPHLNAHQLDAVALYLTQKRSGTNTLMEKLEPPKDAKCPICGMFVAKYPKWVAMMQTATGKKLWFDGVKDMMKYYFNHHQERFEKILVNDFYTLKPIDAKSAWYVIGSNVYGPMGEELIPFKTKEDAQTFQKEHFGKKIIRFNEIKERYLY